MKIQYPVLALALMCMETNADNSTIDSAIRGKTGGAAGAAIGDKVGGQDGAIVGGVISGAVGTAIATDHNGHRSKDNGATRYGDYEDNGLYEVRYAPPHYHAPPGIPPGHQPSPGSCRELRHPVPRGAWIVRG